MVEEVGLAGAGVPQGGKESGEAHPEVRFPIDDSVSHASGFGTSKPKDDCGLLIGEGLVARGDEGLWAVDPDVLAQEAGDESGDGRGRAHDDGIVPVDSRRTASRQARALAGFGSWWGRLRGTMVR